MDGSELLSIKDFSKHIGVKQSILRHYDDIGLFSPAKRGENGYRYYSPLQITAFNMVGVLCDLRTVLREIGDLQRKRDPNSILEHLARQEERFDVEMRRLQESCTLSRIYRHMIEEALSVDENAVIEKDMAENPIFIGPENQFEDTTEFFKDFIAFCQYAQNRNISLSYPIGALFNSMDVFMDRPSQPNFFYSIDPHGCDKKEAGHYLVAYTRGYYGKTNDITERMSDYAKKHNLGFNGPVYSIYLLDEVSISDPDQYMARICVQVKV